MRASLAGYLNTLPILYLGSKGQKTHSNRLPIRLSIFVGPTNSSFHYLHLLGQQIWLPIFFSLPAPLSFALARTRPVRPHAPPSISITDFFHRSGEPHDTTREPRRSRRPSSTASGGPLIPCSIASGAPSVWARWRRAAPPRGQGMPVPARLSSCKHRRFPAWPLSARPLPARLFPTRSDSMAEVVDGNQERRR